MSGTFSNFGDKWSIGKENKQLYLKGRFYYTVDTYLKKETRKGVIFVTLDKNQQITFDLDNSFEYIDLKKQVSSAILETNIISLAQKAKHNLLKLIDVPLDITTGKIITDKLLSDANISFFIFKCNDIDQNFIAVLDKRDISYIVLSKDSEKEPDFYVTNFFHQGEILDYIFNHSKDRLKLIGKYL